MPRYKYPRLVAQVKKFAEENKLDFRQLTKPLLNLTRSYTRAAN